MKVKCKICGLKGFFDESKVSEFWATRFLFIGKFKKNKMESYVVCRKCIRDILDSLQSEQGRIDNLYEPEVKEKKRKGKIHTK